MAGLRRGPPPGQGTLEVALPGRPVHLVRRFVGSLGGREPDPADEVRLLARMREVEVELYGTLSTADRRHAVACATAAATLLGSAATDDLVVAAALHDVGKLDSGLGTAGRVVASVAAGVLGRDRLGRLGARWGPASRWATYADHAELGARRLAALGCADPVVVWAREHHLPPEQSSLGADVARVLAAADDR